MQKQFVLWRFSGSSAISFRLPFVDSAFNRGAFSCDDISSVKGNQHISQINPTHWSVILRDHVKTVDFDLLLLCQVVSFNCVGAFYCCKTWSNNNAFVVKPFQQMYSGIVVHPIFEWTTTTFFQILFGYLWTSTNAIWAKGGNW